jgi:signal transduction histidine kinase
VSCKLLPEPQLFAGRRWAVGTAIVTAIALVQIAPSLIKGDPSPRIFLQVALWVLETPVQMVVLSIAFDRAMRRGHGSTRVLLESLLISGLIGCVFLLSLLFLTVSVFGIDPALPRPLSYPAAGALGAVIGLLLCGIWALAFVYPYAAEQSQLRALETERLRLEADRLRAAAELSRLRAQLEPHFLLNTLNAIAGLVTQNPREARRLIGCLGDLLRDSLRDEDELQPLEQEIAWLKRYAMILESRHGAALRFDWDVSEETRALLLPRLLLQPLVENAVQHGALHRERGGLVTVRTYLASSTQGGEPSLVCVVSDNGPGIGSRAPRPEAFGIRAVQRRLELKYASSKFSLESSEHGTRSIVELPAVGADLVGTS